MIFNIFCHHKWKSHIKKSYKEAKFHEPYLEKYYSDFTIEILICEKCGKIKKIKY